ncbi:hypothetical protein BFJ72_g14990 [Fusarium proliferatum]|uniref:Hydrophobin n=1 Tax=Gibberella intermedia TaxID=948311 RepID=A0A420RV07_GIBIN|nr:hypothetical protein BFJ72_g14990 [Fusarium proliferatum]
MHFFTIVGLLAAAAAASPQVKSFPPMHQITPAQANQACDNNMEIHCCNEKKEEDNHLFPSLSGLKLFGQCSKINLDVMGGGTDLLNKQCQSNAACCHGSTSNASGGLINIALPCVALSSLI